MLQVRSVNTDSLLEQIIDAIESVECKNYFSDHIGKSQNDQKEIVSNFQKAVLDSLANKVTIAKWQLEYLPSTNTRDSIDIFGQTESSVIAIELDKHRADQVAKKFVSRVATLPNTNVYFVSLCYPGTAKMSKSETVKYFGYCSNLAQRIGTVYAGFIIE